MRTFALSLATVLIVATAHAQTASTPECRPAPDPAYKEFVVDAVSQDATGDKHYQLHDQVRVVVINQNPFLYDYKLEVEEKEIEEAGLAAFLKAFLPIADSIPSAAASSAPPQVEIAKMAASVEAVAAAAQKKKHPCGDLFDQAAALRAVLKAGYENLEMKRPAAAAAVEAAQDEYKVFAAKANLEVTSMSDPSTTCPTLPRSARSFVSLVTSYEGSNQLGILGQTLTGFSKLLSEMDQTIGLYRSLFKDQSETCRALIAVETAPWKDRVDAYRAALTGFETTAEKLETALGEAKKQRDDVQAVLRRPTHPFFGSHDLGPYDRPTDVTLKPQRKTAGDAKAKFADLGPWKLNFGDTARFSISAGLSYSSLDEQSFKVVKGFARDREGNLRMENMAEVFTDVIAIDDESGSRITPLVLLNGRLWRPEPTSKARRWISGVYLSTGLSGKAEGGSLKAELLVGPSLGFIEERLFLTVGAYRGRFEKLADDLFVGGAVPDEAKGAVPTSHESRWTLGVALSYRIR